MGDPKEAAGGVAAPRGPGAGTAGFGQSQRAILETLKRSGEGTIPKIANALGLNVETVRDHLKTLAGMGLVERAGSLRKGPGRPEIVYALTTDADRLFPRREGEVLRALATHLRESGQESVLREFFDGFIGERRAESMARVAHLEGRERLDEAARILTELGFMALVEESPDGPKLRLCHCPLRELVEVTKIPCRAEIGFVTELLGERLTRVSYIPAGDASCSYRGGTPCSSTFQPPAEEA
jgi:predicted ArsR family transcriptional regulator